MDRVKKLIMKDPKLVDNEPTPDSRTLDSAAILTRRAFLIGSALSGIGLSMGVSACARPPEPQPCLKPSPPIEDHVALDPMVETIRTMDNEELLVWAESSVEQQRELLEVVLDMTIRAREEQDAPALQCLSETLAGIRGLVRASESSLVALRAAITRGDVDEARHQAAVVMIADEKVRALYYQAETCSYEEPETCLSPQICLSIEPDPPQVCLEPDW